MSSTALAVAPRDTVESPIRARMRSAPPLVARLVPQRELLLKRSWIIGGYGKPIPRRSIEEAMSSGRRLVRPYQLRLDQIIPPADDVYELSEDQILRD